MPGASPSRPQPRAPLLVREPFAFIGKIRISHILGYRYLVDFELSVRHLFRDAKLPQREDDFVVQKARQTNSPSKP